VAELYPHGSEWLHEGDEPDALADLRHADTLAGKHVT
jgi:hypothetical protein